MALFSHFCFFSWFLGHFFQGKEKGPNKGMNCCFLRSIEPEDTSPANQASYSYIGRIILPDHDLSLSLPLKNNLIVIFLDVSTRDYGNLLRMIRIQILRMDSGNNTAHKKIHSICKISNGFISNSTQRQCQYCPSNGSPTNTPANTPAYTPANRPAFSY